MARRRWPLCAQLPSWSGSNTVEHGNMQVLTSRLAGAVLIHEILVKDV